MITWIASHPPMLLFLAIALGSAIGSIKVKSVSLGAAAVLFVAIFFSAVDPRLAVSEPIGALGLTMFAYCVGLVAGPSFVAGFRRSLGKAALVAGALVATAATAFGIATALGLSRDVAAGVFAGSTTNTPALAAALERAHDHAMPTVGYSISYPFGVLIMLAGAVLALRATSQENADELTNATITVERSLGSVAQLQERYGVLLSRYEHDGTMRIAAPEVTLVPGDRVVAVGAAAAVAAAAAGMGHRSSHALHLERSDIHYRRVTISRREIIGKRIGELDLLTRFGGGITRVRRMDQDMLATPDLVLQEADRVRVAAPHERMSELVDFLGDSEHASADINAFGLALGLFMALALGSVSIPLPGLGTFELGSAAGPLILGMLLGWRRRSGRIIWALPSQAADALSHFGLLVFLAYAGGRAGAPFMKALQSPLGAKIMLAAFVVTLLYTTLLYAIGRRMSGVDGPFLGGMMAGAQTQPAVLAMANDRTHHDPRVALGYATVYPVAMIMKILLAQLMLL